jgi:uncharacterized Zn finger protein
MTDNNPSVLSLQCPECGDLTIHDVLRGKISRAGDVIEATVRCQQCGRTSNTVVREARLRSVPLIVSDMGESKRSSIDLQEDEEVFVGDEIFVDDLPVQISAIERKGARVAKALASEIDTIWAKRFDKVRVRVAINKVSRTISADIWAAPEEEFFVGDLITVGRDEVVIHSIKAKDGMAHSGSVPAKDIVRIFAKKPRTTYA